MAKIKNYTVYILTFLIILLGIFLRTKAYILNNVFEDDECRLALSLSGNHLWQMFGTLGPWSSSPIFMFVSKIIAHFSDYNEHALKLIPYIASLVSIFFFYKLSTKMFVKKHSQIFANFLFAINFTAIYFSSAFKQYELELLAAVLCLFYMPKINILKLNLKQTFIFSIILSVLPLISLPSLIYIGAFAIINIYINLKNKKEVFKKLCILFSPLATIMIFYYIFNLAPTKALQLTHYKTAWLEFYSNNLLTLITDNLKYFFWGCKYTLFLWILMLCSIITVCTNRNRRRKIDIFVLTVFGLTVFASVTHLYPFMTRSATHIIPVLIYLMIQSLDYFNTKNISSFIILLSILIGFHEYFIPQYFVENVYRYPENMVICSPKKLMKVITENISAENDKIIINEASIYSYYFYAKKYHIPNFENINITISAQGKKEIVASYINKLNPNKNYWIYIIKDYPTAPNALYIANWAVQQNVSIFLQDKLSFLYFITPPYTKYPN